MLNQEEIFGFLDNFSKAEKDDYYKDLIEYVNFYQVQMIEEKCYEMKVRVFFSSNYRDYWVSSDLLLIRLHDFELTKVRFIELTRHLRYTHYLATRYLSTINYN